MIVFEGKGLVRKLFHYSDTGFKNRNVALRQMQAATLCIENDLQKEMVSKASKERALKNLEKYFGCMAGKTTKSDEEIRSIVSEALLEEYGLK